HSCHPRGMRSVGPAFLLTSLLFIAGCACDPEPMPVDAGTDAGGRDAGPRDGGVDAPRADAGPIVTECGTPTFPGTDLRRHPYLQSVTSTSARVVWTTLSAGTPRVRVWQGADPGTFVDAVSEDFPTTRTTDTVDYVAHDATLTGLEP